MNLCTTCSREYEQTIERCPEDGTVLVEVRLTAALGSSASASASSASVEVAFPLNEDLEGSLVGDYEIERVIGRGGMGTVYGARHPVIGKRAAIKVLSAKYSADREAVGRFIQEAQAVNQIGHLNIVDIFAFGTLPDGRVYLVMEWLQGETLNDRLERARMPISEARTILMSLTRALEAAHSAGVIHRDLKPENVFLVPDGEGETRIKLLDFGIAKLSTTNAPAASRTATGMTMGTPLFMSPEQARGHEIDVRTDLYSLGVVAYAMVCGATPFESEPSPVEILSAHILKTPAPPSALVDELPADFEALILELLAKDPAARPTLVEVRRRLSKLATNPNVSAQIAAVSPSGDLAAVERPRRRSWLPWLITGLVLAAAAVVFVVVDRIGTTTGEESKSLAAPTAPSPAPSPAPIVVEQPKPSAPAVTPPKTGVIELAIEPATATATIDGRRIELADGKGRVELAPGNHDLVIAAPTHRAERRSFQVAAAETSQIAINLTRAAKPSREKPTKRTKPKNDTDGVVNPFAKKRAP